MKLIDRIYDFLFEEVVIEKPEKPVYISCSDLFIKR